MIKCEIPFRCTDCNKKIIGYGIEWQATALSIPVP